MALRRWVAAINPLQRAGLPTRMRAAAEALPYENPKLSAVAVASMDANDFAARLESGDHAKRQTDRGQNS